MELRALVPVTAFSLLALCLALVPMTATAEAPTAADAKAFVEKAEEKLLAASIAAERANWVASNFITEDTELIAAEGNQRRMELAAGLAKEATRFDGLALDAEVARKLALLKLSLTLAAPADPKKSEELVARYRTLAHGGPVSDVPEPDALSEPERPAPDLADVVGQAEGRLAVEIAAAGAHHLYLVGPPGAGKSMLAERLPGLLPELDDHQAMEVTAIASILGTLASFDGLCRRPPFVAPHHGASMPAIIGGGSGHVLPGAVTAAHHGVLFLDEAPEFRPGVMQALRQPIESGHVVVARAIGNIRFPCEFQLVLAANPCPCGMGSGKASSCSCTPIQQRRYSGRLSGPILDRIDIQVHVPAPSRAALLGEPGESSEVVRARVFQARATASVRWDARPYAVNGRVPGPVLRSGPFRLGPTRTVDLDRAIDRGLLSLRGYDRCLRLAWTIADLAGRTSPTRDDVGLALSLRHQPALAA